MKLTKEDIIKFDKNGFLVIKDFADSKLCDAIKEIALIHLKYKIEPIEWEWEYIGGSKDKYRSIRRLRQVYNRDILFKQWMENSEIRPILYQLLGETPILITSHHNSIMTKMPHTSSDTHWHRDIRYWNYEHDNLISVWLALGDEYLQNGLLEFIPGSHKIEFDNNSFDEKLFFRDDYKPNQEYIKKRVSIPLKKGDIVLFHSKTLHRANRNITNEPKISFVYTVKGISNKAIPNTRSSKYPEIKLDI